MGAAACKRRREERNPSPPVAPCSSGGGTASSVVSDRDCGKPYCILEACAPVSLQTDRAAAPSGRSWDVAVEHRDVCALGRSDLGQLDSRNADRSALHACVDAGWLEGVQFLLRKRADPSLADSQGHGPLHAAARLGRGDLLALLANAGAELDAQDRDMEGDEEFRGGHFEKKTANKTPLHYAAEGLHYEACDFLLARGARVDERDCWYKTALHLAEDELASEEQLRVVGLLLRGRADPNLGNLERGPGQTSLLAAVHEKNLPLVALLLRSGADLAASGKQGMCPLHLAARMRNEKLAAMLLSGRADPAQKTPTGLTAADLARANNCQGLAALLDAATLGPNIGTAQGEPELEGAAAGSPLMDELS